MRFYFDEVDADMDLKELIIGALVGFSVVGLPLLFKVVLLWIGR